MKEQIQKYLPGDHPWRNHIHWFRELDSTNTYLKELAKQGAPQGTIILADSQTGGRGRLGRSFHSPAGAGIYMSLLLRPACSPEALMHLTCVSATAVRDAVLHATGIPLDIKWTNDLVYGQRKLAGILTELGLSPRGTVDYAIIGVGLNCCQAADDFPPDIRDIAVSLAGITGKAPDRARIVAAMAESFYRMSQALPEDQPRLLDDYRRHCVTLGKPISLLRGEEVRHGTALDIDSTGALIVEFAPGQTEAVNSGEVSVRGMYGYV